MACFEAPGGAIARCGEPCVSSSAPASFRCHDLSSRLIQICNQLIPRVIYNQRSRRNPDDEVLSGSAVPILAHAVNPVLSAIVLLVLAVQQRVDRRIGQENDVSAFAAVPSVGSSLGHIGLAAKTQTSVAAVAGDNFDAGLVYEFQGSATKCRKMRNLSEGG